MKTKKISAACLIVLAIVVFCVPLSAAATPEQEVANALNDLLVIYPGSAQLAKLVKDANDWLSDSANAGRIDSSSGVATITDQIDKAIKTAGSVDSLSQLSTNQINSIINNINTAVAVVEDLELSYNANNMHLTVTDTRTGKTVTGLNIGDYINTVPSGSSRSRNSSNEMSYAVVYPDYPGNPIRQTGAHINIAGLIVFIIIIVPVPVLAFIICLTRRRSKYFTGIE